LCSPSVANDNSTIALRALLGCYNVVLLRFAGNVGAGLAIVTATTVAPAQTALPATASIRSSAAEPSVPRTTIQLVVNGAERQVEVEDRWTLVELLRDHLELTGTKIGCDRGECGACTVLVDGKPLYSCSYLAVWAHGRSIRTVEGLARHDRLHPLQEAFIAHDGPQCGFCTSGQLMSAVALLERNLHPTRDDVRDALTGNLCRCSNYNHYVDAVVAAAKP
jgi:aerobic-type carbon monoxide dehydrogenase small subunit (CoxS/CutS family)